MNPMNYFTAALRATRRAGLSMLALFLALAPAALAQIWSGAPALPTPRWDSAITLLPSGRVLMAGGGVIANQFLTAADIYDPVLNQWVAGVPTLPQPHRHTAVTLLDGRALVAGDDRSIDYTAYLYDEVNSPGAWITAGQPANQHIAATLTALPSGHALLVGGYCGGSCATYNTAEIFSAQTITWGPAASMSVTRFGHTATLLPSGRVLVTGGANRSPTLVHNEVESYDESANMWTTLAPMNQPRLRHTATLLPNGKVLVVGGQTGPTAFNNHTATTEFYDPATDTWTPGPSMATPRSHHTATLLGNGRVLVAGGQNASGITATCELYDFMNNTWTPTTPMATGRQVHSAVLLPSGQVFVAGGDATLALNSPVAASEIYTPDSCGGPVSGRYSIRTGADEAGNLLAVGASERSFINVGSPVGTNAMVVINPADMPGAWSAPNGISQWVCPSANGSGPAGWYTNLWVFNLPCTNATMSGRISTDDQGDLYLNGVYIGPAGGFGFGFFNFTHTANFRAGPNVLALIVNQGGGPTGFRAELNIQSECCACPSQPITTFNTGARLPLGAVDPNYVLTSNPNGNGSQAQVIDGNGLDNDTTSKWIGPTAGSVAAGTYAYQMQIFLPCADNAEIYGRWAVDNNGAIYVNGGTTAAAELTGGGGDNFSRWHAFSIRSGLWAGLNTITFNVSNQVNSPTGLRVELAASANCCCPPTNTVVLNSGYDHTAGGTYAIGAADAFWTVTADPDSGTVEPRPATVITKHPAWAPPGTDSQWLSSYPTAADDLNGAYDFETRFCLQPGWSNVVLNLCVRGDDQSEVFLNGVSILTGPSPGFRVGDQACVTVSDPGQFLTGPNSLMVRTRNIYRVAMGFNLTGTVTGSGVALDQPGCCQSGSSLSGQKFNDLNNNGQHEANEPALPNWPIQLSNGQSTTTDANGFYYFRNLTPGAYVVTEQQQPGWIQTAPATGGHSVQLGTSRSINRLDFGNHYSETNCVQFGVASNLVAECAGPFGTPVPYTVTASSTCGVVTVVCTPPSPGPFFPGVTTVNCLATDTSGASATCSFRVFVQDNTPPVINCPTNIVVESCTNFPVAFNVTASDSCSSNVTVVCTPPSNYAFPPGVTVVSCVATDGAGLTSQCDFTVTVNPSPRPLRLYNTGVDNTGAELPGGAQDLLYTLGNAVNSVVIQDPNIGWLPNTTISKWIGVNASAGGGVGLFRYQTTFNVPCTNNVSIAGQWAADNGGFIFLNNATTPLASITTFATADSFNTWHPFTITSGLRPGLNTLTFVVTNAGSVTGLRVEMTGTANCCCSVLSVVSSTNVTGPYTAETGAVIDEVNRTITVPRSGPIRFYQIQATCSAWIVSSQISGANLVLRYEF